MRVLFWVFGAIATTAFYGSNAAPDCPTSVSEYTCMDDEAYLQCRIDALPTAVLNIVASCSNFESKCSDPEFAEICCKTCGAASSGRCTDSKRQLSRWIGNSQFTCDDAILLLGCNSKFLKNDKVWETIGLGCRDTYRKKCPQIISQNDKTNGNFASCYNNV